jgi:hypothetical protein
MLFIVHGFHSTVIGRGMSVLSIAASDG